MVVSWSTVEMLFAVPIYNKHMNDVGACVEHLCAVVPRFRTIRHIHNVCARMFGMGIFRLGVLLVVATSSLDARLQHATIAFGLVCELSARNA